MGLCKCPKKRVTNQFCFEHRENVCEHCLVANHPKCIVQSYLKWLQDSDYEPLCQLCKKDLAADDCIRLLCYHVFHWGCLDAFARQLPPQTAPAGFTCPTCSTGLFPAVNTVSPVADALRQTLSRVNWARAGLSLPMIDEVPVQSSTAGDYSAMSHQHHNHHQAQLTHQQDTAETTPLLLGSSSPQQQQQQHTTHHSSSSSVAPSLSNHTLSAGLDRFSSQAPQMDSFPNSSIFTSVAFTSARKPYDTTEKDGLRRTPFVDHDEDKYKRRSALEWFSRWFKSRTSLGRHSHSLRPDPRVLYKRWFFLGILILLGLCTLVLIFVRLGRASADVDPLLDPRLNPNIRVDNSMDTGQGADGLAVAEGLGIHRGPREDQNI